MYLCSFLKSNSNNEASFIDVYNWGDYIIRYTGIYYVGGYPSRFCSWPIFPLDHIKTTFPDDAELVQGDIDYWFTDIGLWTTCLHFAKDLPGGFCFRSAGTLEHVNCAEILCP